MTDEAPPPPAFEAAFRTRLAELFRWRRDVRHFRTDPLPEGALELLVETAHLAPSVGYSQPWRFVSVESGSARSAVRESFAACNADALAGYDGERRQLYARLKLSGLEQAPAQLAVFTDTGTERGHGLGRRTMPETLAYSTAMAVHTLWLAARAHDIGVGWVSILDPVAVKAALDVPAGWDLTAYLCLGYPEAASPSPELQRAGWENAAPEGRLVLRR